MGNQFDLAQNSTGVNNEANAKLALDTRGRVNNNCSWFDLQKSRRAASANYQSRDENMENEGRHLSQTFQVSTYTQSLEDLGGLSNELLLLTLVSVQR